eukprot:740223-Prymnesium_polylepis.2
MLGDGGGVGWKAGTGRACAPDAAACPFPRALSRVPIPACPFPRAASACHFPRGRAAHLPSARVRLLAAVRGVDAQRPRAAASRHARVGRLRARVGTLPVRRLH